MGFCAFPLACVKATHSAVFHNHIGTISCSIPNASFFSAPYTRTLARPSKDFVYSPFGSSTINLVLGALCSFFADSIDHRIKPATEHDLPLPVFPRTARCLPKSLSGSTDTTAFPAKGLIPIFTLRLLPDSTIAFSCVCVGINTGSPTVGKTSIPRSNSYSILPAVSPTLSFKIPSGTTLIFRNGYGRSKIPKSCIPRRLGNWERSIVIHSI